MRRSYQKNHECRNKKKKKGVHCDEKVREPRSQHRRSGPVPSEARAPCPWSGSLRLGGSSGSSGPRAPQISAPPSLDFYSYQSPGAGEDPEMLPRVCRVAFAGLRPAA